MPNYLIADMNCLLADHNRVLDKRLKAAKQQKQHQALMVF